MPDLLDLASPPVARNTDPATSHAAARTVTRRRETQAAILHMLDRYGPLTDAQIAEYYPTYVGRAVASPASPSGLRTRRSELVREGKVIDTGVQTVLASGRWAIRWGLA